MFKFLIPTLISFSFTLKSQQISQLGSLTNNPNFVCKYYQNTLITSTTAGIKFIDVSNSASPVFGATIGNPSGFIFPMAIEVNGSYAYFGGGYSGYLMIVDVSNPAAPFQTGITYNLTGGVRQISVIGNTAYAVTSSDSLFAIDISNKTNPIVLGKVFIGQYCYGVFSLGNFTYVAATNGLHTVNTSNPANMNIIHTLPGAFNNSISCDTLNKKIFVTAGQPGFDVISYTNLSSTNLLYHASGGSAMGPLVYKLGHIFQTGSGVADAYTIGSSSASYLCNYNATITGQQNGIDAKDSTFYVSTVNNIHVLQLNTGSIDLQEKNPKEINFSVFPSPNNGAFTLKFNTDTKRKIKIVNVLGEVVYSRELEDMELNLNLNTLASGIYSMMVSEGDTIGSKQFVIQ